MQIQNLIPDIGIETREMEFKTCLRRGLDKKGEDNELKWLREVSAFANTKGGDIYVGVNDRTHEIEPLSHEEVDKTVQLIYDAIEARVEPNISPKIDYLKIPDTNPSRFILIIHVAPSKVLPVYVHVNGVPACFVRQFGRAKIASPEQIASMVLSSESVSYDDRPTSETYEEGKFSIFLNRYRLQTGLEKPDPRQLELIGFMDANHVLSSGGLLFSDDCVDEITTIKIAKYPGVNPGSDSLLSEKVIKGNLPRTIDEAIAFIDTVSTNGYRKTATGRETIRSFPKRSLIEGIANAVAHRNYFLKGSFIEINLFVDRLEITSPGALLGGLTFARNKDILSIHPKHRNPVIAKTLNLLHYIEAKGTGFDKIALDYDLADESHKPFISCDSDAFTLTLPDLCYPKGVIGEDNQYPDIHLPEMIISSYDERILSCCYYKARTLVDIASFLGVAPSTYLRTKVLERLVEEGYLQCDKIGKAMVYRTVKSKLDTIFALRQ